ncbi:delta and Notch-like epidermal growth factor-related receptor [Brienomyrus brachyistius]|uniref:delta and Notch-like epidermal growth factor-related receptor n=1 Tax=Brienomyrus brachyistius TaxID=42636 RepID=UPI0020B34105|nr:delta and Notch-like epidermal growth factor-related receptor [Brienomyrus brachyistius]
MLLRAFALLLLSAGCCLTSPPTPALSSSLIPSLATPPPDPCEGHPCLNSGSCISLSSSLRILDKPPDTETYTCACIAGFTGHNCEFFVDLCASNPCVHGNCSDVGGMYTCECSEGFEGERCDQPSSNIPMTIWESSSLTSEHATLATAVTSAVPTEAMQATPTTEPTSTQALPTLQPWQPTTEQRVATVIWDNDQVQEMSDCRSLMGRDSSGAVYLALELAEGTAIKIQANITGIAGLWRVSEGAFHHCTVSDGTVVWLQQASDGLVLTEQYLPLGQSYFVGVLHDVTANGDTVTLLLQVTMKASSCTEPGSHFNDPQCSGKGTCVTQPSKNTFYCECEKWYSGIFCEEFDACHLNPCKNNGTCSDLREGNEGRNFTCACPSGYTGEQCEALVDHCLSQPCLNGATCTSNLAGPSCHCPEGYQGWMCEQKINPCASSPCHNNGTCYSDEQSFSCSCAPGFTGSTCAQLVDFCTLNPCAHGICRSVGTSYRCLCVPGYHGLYCEEEYNECLSAPCQNHATCRDLVNAYDCICPEQYEGRHCEVYKDPCLKVHCQNGGSCDREGLNATCVCPAGYTGENCEVDINECDSNPCHHGATCIDQSNGFICHCQQGWVGPNCEIYLQWKAAHPDDSLTSMPRHSLYIIIGALCVAFILMLIILIVGICRISRIEYQGSSRHAYQEFYNCRSIDSEFNNAIASIRHARFGKKSRPAMYDATPISYEDYSPDDKPLVTLIKTKDL